MAVDNIARALAAKALGGSSGPVTPEDVVTGIIIDGTELVADSEGKVALPIVTDTSESMATGDSALGLCKIMPNSMLSASGGALDVKEASPSVIAQRSSAASDVVLTAPYVNDIVKAALTDENRISGLTEEEKKNACTVLGAVTDVTADGKSVVDENGAANIPVATPNTLGLTTADGNYGVMVSGAGYLTIPDPTDVQISDRVQSPRRLITTNKLVYAVDSVICSTRESERLTAEQQAAAQERLGIDKPYELIEEITLTENVDSITRSTDTQGNAYNFKSVIIYAQLAANTENSTLRVYVNGLTYVSITAQNAISTSERYDKMEITCSRGVIRGTNVNSNSINGSSNIASTAFLAIGHSAITSFNITSTKGIPSGSTIQIYGVR